MTQQNAVTKVTRYNYSAKNHDPLVNCPWCGYPARMHVNDRVRECYDGMPTYICDQFRVVCTNQRARCSVSTYYYETSHFDVYDRHNDKSVGYDRPDLEAVKVWNARDVCIPLMFDMPNNHIVHSLVEEKSDYSWRKKYKARVEISDARGIAETFANRLDFLLENGKYHPCRFNLRFSMENWTVSIASAEMKYHSYPHTYEFVVHARNSFLGNNNQDNAWKKRDYTKPLILDTMLEKMTSEDGLAEYERKAKK